MNRIDRFTEAIRPLPPHPPAKWGGFDTIQRETRYIVVQADDRPSAAIGWLALCCWTGATFAAGVLAGAIWVAKT